MIICTSVARQEEVEMLLWALAPSQLDMAMEILKATDRHRASGSALSGKLTWQYDAIYYSNPLKDAAVLDNIGHLEMENTSSNYHPGHTRPFSWGIYTYIFHVYIYIHIYIYMHMCACVYINAYIVHVM